MLSPGPLRGHWLTTERNGTAGACWCSAQLTFALDPGRDHSLAGAYLEEKQQSS